MARRSSMFDHWPTGTKLLVLLTLALFPLGLALAWTARASLQDVRGALIDSAQKKQVAAGRRSLITASTRAHRANAAYAPSASPAMHRNGGGA